MRQLRLAMAGLLLAAGLSIVPASAQEGAPVPQPAATVRDVPDLYRSVTGHEMTIRGKKVRYQAVAGDTYLYDLAGNVTASIFSFTYQRTDLNDANRPVLFIFNGGPGSASLWIHMGAIGPRQVVLDADVNPSNVPPFGLRDNPNSILDIADLVFIDPVGTGFSRALNGTDPASFWGVDEDAESVAQFIESWLTEYGRWNAPKYVLGESYGSVRAAVLPRALMGSPIYNGLMRGITLDGIVLLGTTLGSMGGNDTAEKPAELVAAERARTLPGLAVTSSYHGLAPGKDDIAGVYRAASDFAAATYRAALLKQIEGTLGDAERALVLNRLEAFTGLKASDIGDDLYIDERSYAKAALAPKELEAGMYDSRYTLPLASSGFDPVADDPAMGRYVPGFIAAFHQMLRDDLGVSVMRPYLSIRWKDLLSNWNWKRSGPIPSQNYAQELAWAMRRNPDLRVFVASGYFDLVTTPADAKAQIEEGGVPTDSVLFREYESGHMLYLGGTSEAFSSDLRSFILARD